MSSRGFHKRELGREAGTQRSIADSRRRCCMVQNEHILETGAGCSRIRGNASDGVPRGTSGDSSGVSREHCQRRYKRSGVTHCCGASGARTVGRHANMIAWWCCPEQIDAGEIERVNMLNSTKRSAPDKDTSAGEVILRAVQLHDQSWTRSGDLRRSRLFRGPFPSTLDNCSVEFSTRRDDPSN
jgi:hypothetical protein